MRNIQSTLKNRLLTAHYRLVACDAPGSNLKEDVSPCLSVLWIIARTSRPARKYLKTVILPPLTAEAVKVDTE